MLVTPCFTSTLEAIHAARSNLKMWNLRYSLTSATQYLMVKSREELYSVANLFYLQVK